MNSELLANWLLDPSIVFLNHGSFGACPKPVLAVQQREREAMEREPVRYLGRELEGRIDGARTEVARFVGADARDLVFVANATTGVNAVVRSLRFSAGDELLALDHGYNACLNALAFAAEQGGAKVVLAKVPFPLASEEQVLEPILAAVTPRTRFALIDHITAPTGLVLPIARIVRELESRGVQVMVDGAHAPGMVPLELNALGASYYAGNCHKWLCGPKGVAFLHVRRELQPGIRPTVISHGANSTRTDRSRFQLEFDWVGTVDPTAVLSLPEAIRFMATLVPGGWPELMQRNRALALQARVHLLGVLGIPSPAPESMMGSLAALPLPDGPSEALGAALFARGIEVPLFPWPAEPKRLLRISAQLYNSMDDYVRLGQTLKELVAR